MKGIFITGTDTEVGKTHVSEAVLRELVRRGIRAIGMKPVASGARQTIDGPRNEDAERLRAASAIQLAYDLVNPYVFLPPIAPHLAAEAAGIEIRFEPILAAAAALRREGEFLLVEGVGGWRVPLGRDGDVSALAGALDLPVILVVGLRLGCISHALLTAEAIRADGRVLAGWIGNVIDRHYQPRPETLATLARRLGSPPLAVFPNQGESGAVTGAAACDAVQALLCVKSQ